MLEYGDQSKVFCYQATSLHGSPYGKMYCGIVRLSSHDWGITFYVNEKIRV
jgi:hypothetical protein